MCAIGPIRWPSVLEGGVNQVAKAWVFLDALFGEPLLCTPLHPGFRGFIICVVSVISANPALNALFVAV